MEQKCYGKLLDLTDRSLIDAEKKDQAIDLKGYKHKDIINKRNMDGLDRYRKLLNAQMHKDAFIDGNRYCNKCGDPSLNFFIKSILHAHCPTPDILIDTKH